jgi:outer membrane protein
MSNAKPTRSSSRSTARGITLVSALLLAAVAPRVYAQARIGVIDIRRAVSETNEGRAATGAIKARFDERQTDLDRRTKAIEGLKTKLEHPRPGTPQPQLQKMAQDLQHQVMEVQQLGQQYTGEIQQMEGELTKNILTKMQPIVREIGNS